MKQPDDLDQSGNYIVRIKGVSSDVMDGKACPYCLGLYDIVDGKPQRTCKKCDEVRRD